MSRLHRRDMGVRRDVQQAWLEPYEHLTISLCRYYRRILMREDECQKQRKTRYCDRGKTEEGIIPQCTRVFISGHRDARDDYHRDMDSVVFEEWLRTSVLLMQSFANGRHVTLVMDNAPYHSRVIEKIPTASSRKQEIVVYLRSKGVEVADDRSKEQLLQELEMYLRSRGGVNATRVYAVENICTELGIAVIRLPPYHCFFNPIELCWSQLKHHLCKIGKPSDKLATVRARTLDWMQNVPVEMCQGWCREARREEDAARLKERIDSNSNNIDEWEAGEVEEDSLSSSSDDLELSDEDLSDVSMSSHEASPQHFD